MHRLIFRRSTVDVLFLSKIGTQATTNLSDARRYKMEEIVIWWDFRCALAALFLSCWFSCLQNIARNLLSWDGSWWDFALLPRRPLLQIPHVFFWRLFSRAGNIRLVWNNTSCLWQKKHLNLISRKSEQHQSMSWECVSLKFILKNLGLWESRETDWGKPDVLFRGCRLTSVCQGERLLKTCLA